MRRLPANRALCRQVLDCGSPLPLFGRVSPLDGLSKRQRTGAVQDAGARHDAQRLLAAIGQALTKAASEPEVPFPLACQPKAGWA